MPNLKTNAEGLKKVLEDLVKTYKGKEADLDKWKASLMLPGSSLAWCQGLVY